MTLTVQLSPEIEAKLLQQATLIGKLPERIALEAIEEKLAAGDEVATRLSKEEWHRRFDDLITSMPKGNLDADLSRESVYDGRGI